MPNPNDGVIAAESNVLGTAGGAVTGPLTLTGTPPLVIPASAGAGKVASCDASGNLSWQTAASLGTLSLSGGDLGGSVSVPTVTASHLAAPLPVAQGGTNAATAAAALTSLGAAALAGNTFTGANAPAVAVLTYGASVAVNAALGNVLTLTLTGSAATLAAPSNPVDGQDITVRVTQGGSGSYTLAYATAYDFGAAGAPTLSTAAGKVDEIRFRYNAALTKWCCSGSSLGF